MNKKPEGMAKTKNLTIRLTPDQLARVSKLCHRDEMQPGVFAREVFWQAVEKLAEKQKKFGYKCQQDPN